MSVTTGTAKCPECGAVASAILADESTLKVVCDTCFYEVWGAVSDPLGAAIAVRFAEQKP